jgi:hypothetical protein
MASRKIYLSRNVEDVDVSGGVNDGEVLVWDSGAGDWIPSTVSGASGATTFAALTDTPASYATYSGYFVKVTDAEDGLEFAASVGGVTTFLGLTDTPSSFSGEGEKFLKVNAGENAVEFVTTTIPASFTDLDDVPSDYTGKAGLLLAVNGGENALEFVPSGVYPTTFLGLADTPASYSGEQGNALVVAAGEATLEFTTITSDSMKVLVSADDTTEDYLENKIVAGSGISIVVQNPGGNENLKFNVTVSGGSGASVFTDLTDVPSSYSSQGGKLVAVNAGEDALEFVPSGVYPTAFLGLGDTPSDYSGQSGKVAAVKSTEDGLEFVVASGSGASAFTDLSDVPSSYTSQGGKVVSVKDTEDGLEFTTVSGGTGATTFLALTDTPDTFTDHELDFVVVSGMENALMYLPQNRAPKAYGDIIPAEPYRTYIYDEGSSEFEIYGDLDGWGCINGGGTSISHTTLSGWLNGWPTDDYYDCHNSVPSHLILYPYGVGEKIVVKKALSVSSGQISVIACKVAMHNSNNTGDKISFMISTAEPNGGWGSGIPNGAYGCCLEINRNGDNINLRHYHKDGAGELNVDTTTSGGIDNTIYLAFTTESNNDIKAWWSLNGISWNRVTQGVSSKTINGAIAWVSLGLYDGSLAEPGTMMIVDWIRILKNDNNLWRIAGNWKNDW